MRKVKANDADASDTLRDGEAVTDGQANANGGHEESPAA